MQNDSRLVKLDVIKFVMNIVIVAMCFLTLICAWVAVEEVFDDYFYRADEDTFFYQVDDGDFFRTVQYYYQNMADGYEDDRSLQEYYGVAKYYEAASLYKAFLETGDTVRAERELTKMKQALEQMGGWGILERDIKNQLGF